MTVVKRSGLNQSFQYTGGIRTIDFVLSPPLPQEIVRIDPEGLRTIGKIGLSPDRKSTRYPAQQQCRPTSGSFVVRGDPRSRRSPKIQVSGEKV
jgi:hypothetical protein